MALTPNQRRGQHRAEIKGVMVSSTSRRRWRLLGGRGPAWRRRK
jgi:hypothetical protein